MLAGDCRYFRISGQYDTKTNSKTSKCVAGAPFFFRKFASPELPYVAVTPVQSAGEHWSFAETKKVQLHTANRLS
jgi:hypothetical protein